LIRAGIGLPLLCTFLIALFALLAVLQGTRARAGPSAQQAPTASPDLSSTETAVPPTSTPSPADAALAAQFATDGKLDASIGAYLAVIDEGSPGERLAARLAVARVYIDAGDATSAIEQLDSYLLEAPSGRDVRGAQFLLAEALALDGRWDESLALYEAYIEAGGGASLYARAGRAEALARVGRIADANAEGEALLEEDLPSRERLGFALTVAGIFEEESPGHALVWYQRLATESQGPGDTALGLWKSALMQAELGDESSLASSAASIIQQYPETSAALSAAKEVPEAASSVSPYVLGLTYFRNGRASDAQRLFEDAASNDSGGADSARAAYYLATMYEIAGETAETLDMYARVVELAPQVELADDALWWRGRLLEQEDRAAEARVAYARLVSEYGGTDWGKEARFRLGILDYDAGRFDAAARAFAVIAGGTRDEERERALLWQGRALDASGAGDEAEAVLSALVSEAPAGFYSLRAAVALGDDGGDLDGVDLSDAGPVDWGAVARWVRSATGNDPALALDDVLYDAHWGMGQELLSLGMRRRADAEFSMVLEGAGRDPVLLYQLAREFDSAGLPHLASRAATRLLDAVADDQTANAPEDIWRVAYPAPYPDLIEDASDQTDVPELLLLALIRQESTFDPLAGSSAGALGLTQVVPATGDTIAADLEATGYETEHLFRPSVSIDFGAHYLSEQLDTFDGELFHALAAYNAGPGPAERWGEAAGDDVDRFIAEIEFSQTRAYVRIVAENLARYRQLYEGLERPALPGD
jgi:soluble lytic murein transglycosylase